MELQTQESIFTDEATLEMAGHGRRLANYIIDLVSFYIVLIVVIIPITIAYPDLLDFADSPGMDYLDRLLAMVAYGIYMGVIEAVFKGKSLGKLITGTRAVNEDGSEISAKTAFLRGLSRAVPFDAFSAFGGWCHPWHDRWTDTYVIDVKKSIIPVGK
ncbi:RDD family protein [Chitinophaga sp. ARDCPP14]|uniref:RDD family protein n=1 Tax=Chitinophaga sp. ARDCPP14 TaxID=3391139 RepID=UPI003F5222DA